MTIWQKYFLKKTLGVFFLFIICFYGLYVLIDYSSRSSTAYMSNVPWKAITQFYLATFIVRLDLILPFALIIATINSLTSLNIRGELVALMSSGIPQKKLLSPFLWIGLICTTIVYFNMQFFLPAANRQINHIRDHYFHGKTSKGRKVHALTNNLVYHRYNHATDSLEEVFLVNSFDDIYYIDSLETKTSIGKNALHIRRDKQSNLVPLSTVNNKKFDIKIDPEKLNQILTLPKDNSIVHLIRKAFDFDGKIWTALLSKLTLPWLCLIAVSAPIPFCIRFTRQLPVFMIYLVALIGLITFYLAMNAMQILGENHVINPAIAIAIPFVLYAAALKFVLR